jgi:hypothetical protein
MPNTSFSSSSEDVSDDVTLALARLLFSMIFTLHVCIFSYEHDFRFARLYFFLQA